MKIFFKHIRFIIFLITFSPVILFAQKTTKVQLLNSNKLIGVKTDGKELNRLIGDVILKHDSTIFYCDSAYLYKGTNNFEAFSNVHIIVNDSVEIFGDILNYNGNSRIAELFYNVKLIDNKATLTTEHLFYNRNTKIAFYNTGGKIVDKENQLTSVIGYYYTSQKEFFFKDSVVLINPDYIMNSDTLMYNTETETSYFYGPTTIIGDEDSIYCEDGWYDTQFNITRLKKNLFIQHNEQIITGDTIYYDKTKGYSLAINNVVLIDTLQDVVVKGNLAEYQKNKGFAFVTDSALAITIDNNDSLFLHADTLKIVFDTAHKAKILFAYNKAKFYREDIQGLCDSLVYNFKDSTITLYNEPVLWSDSNQLTADSIKIVIANNEIDTMVLFNSSFIISRDDTATFNQIKGKNMVAYFTDNELKKITVDGNSQTIYFVREETGELIGINKAVSSKMLIFLENKQMKTITYIDFPKETLFPEKDLSPKDIILKGFKWLEEKRPRNKMEIFYW